MSGVLVERHGPVVKIINNNPAARNALSFAFSTGATEALKAAGEDKMVAAVVLCGAEGFFCAGGDLNVLIKRREMAVPDRLEAIEVLHGLIRAIRACPKPVIAAVEGGAAGAGAPLALACDMIVAAEDSYFAVNYLRVGLAPDGGSTTFLAEALPRQLANEIIMFGDKVPVDRLHQFGVINRLTAPGQAEAVAQEIGERINKVGPEAIAAAKRLNLAARSNSLADQLDLEAMAMAESQGGAESGEGISAFLEKRRADFTKFRK
ncbi:MAG: enoyl-CoA hydratase family protein [Proteobacteria bacterium]|nr:enoyl-CoA hydratase family protein [Pseudomonadota bacterium]